MRVVVRSLSKSYGFLWALKKIDIELRAGECIALLGPNGAGKSTLLRLLSALLHPTTGEIFIDGQRLSQGSSPVRSSIGLLTPSEHLYEGLTLRENLRLFNSLYARKKSLQDMEEALNTVGLRRWSDDYVSSLSSGMKCRLTISKWLLLEPKLLLLDEPYGVLDGSGVDLLESYVKRLCQSGGIAVMATHHISRILALCSRALILHQGRLIFDEPRQEPWESFHRTFAEFLPRGDKWSS
ncbi:MAG: heme ABC exporter ATP-binding protein CcmA [Deltaproteobacteria bacterium]|nr:heme ABC exporter ATP-binding protein CcmA [Deltaproteobacteria bacterium]